MKPNVTTLIDHLISLSEDESAEVRETASNVLRVINENLMQNYDMRSLIDSLEDKFYDFLTRFPTLIRRSGKMISTSLLITKYVSCTEICTIIERNYNLNTLFYYCIF